MSANPANTNARTPAGRIDRIRAAVAKALADWWQRQNELADADIEREIARSFPEPLKLPESPRPSRKTQIADGAP